MMETFFILWEERSAYEKRWLVEKPASQQNNLLTWRRKKQTVGYTDAIVHNPAMPLYHSLNGQGNSSLSNHSAKFIPFYSHKRKNGHTFHLSPPLSILQFLFLCASLTISLYTILLLTSYIILLTPSKQKKSQLDRYLTRYQHTSKANQYISIFYPVIYIRSY
jgi:hypothetical protein